MSGFIPKLQPHEIETIIGYIEDLIKAVILDEEHGDYSDKVIKAHNFLREYMEELIGEKK